MGDFGRNNGRDFFFFFFFEGLWWLEGWSLWNRRKWKDVVARFVMCARVCVFEWKRGIAETFVEVDRDVRT